MKPQRKKKPPKSFFDLTPEERDREVARFDREIDLDKEARPLTAKERALFEKMRGRKGRSYETIAVRVDVSLLRQSDAYAAQHNMTRDELINRGLRSALAVLV